MPSAVLPVPSGFQIAPSFLPVSRQTSMQLHPSGPFAQGCSYLLPSQPRILLRKTSPSLPCPLGASTANVLPAKNEARAPPATSLQQLVGSGAAGGQDAEVCGAHEELRPGSSSRRPRAALTSEFTPSFPSLKSMGVGMGIGEIH